MCLVILSDDILFINQKILQHFNSAEQQQIVSDHIQSWVAMSDNRNIKYVNENSFLDVLK